MFDVHDNRLSLLVIDDDAVDVESVRRLFRKRDIQCNIIVARNGIEGIEALERGIESPFFILLDLNMPKMNGIEFLKALRNHPKHKSAIVFVWTTSKDELDLWAAYEHNIAGYLVKSTVNQNHTGVAEILEAYERNVVFPPSVM